MIQLLFGVIFGEAAVIMLLLFWTPLRSVALSALDQVKRGHAPVVVKTICATVFVVLIFSIYSFLEIHNRGGTDEGGDLNATDQVLYAKHLLESSLMGFMLFLALMIDRLHYFIRELSLRRSTMEMEAKKMKNAKSASEEEVKAREQQVETFKELIRNLESELESKVKEANASEANIVALRKQSKGLISEYDQLLAENQELRNHLKTLDQTYSHSPTKKNS